MNPITTLVDFRFNRLGHSPPNIKVANSVLEVLLGVSKPVAVVITVYLFVFRILIFFTPNKKINSLIAILSKLPGTSTLNKLIFSFIDLAVESEWEPTSGKI